MGLVSGASFPSARWVRERWQYSKHDLRIRRKEDSLSAMTQFRHPRRTDPASRLEEKIIQHPAGWYKWLSPKWRIRLG